MKLIDLIYKDLYRYNQNRKGIGGIVKEMHTPGFKFMIMLRLYQNAFCIDRYLYKLPLRKYRIKYGIQIEANTKIGEGFYIGHFGNIVVNGNSIIGKNCNISQGVTIGQANRGNKQGAPVIGNNVWIGANAVIVGKIVIGNNVLIAPLSYVNIDIPANSIVIGNPAKIIENRFDATEGYINNIV